MYQPLRGSTNCFSGRYDSIPQSRNRKFTSNRPTCHPLPRTSGLSVPLVTRETRRGETSDVLTCPYHPESRSSSISNINPYISRPLYQTTNASSFCAPICDAYDSFSQIARISDHLYLSGSHPLQPHRLYSLKIRLIINATVEIPLANFTGIVNIRVPVYDRPMSSLSVYFNSISDRIFNEYQSGGVTLVHCVAGVSRSCTIVLAYLIKYSNMNLREAFKFVKSRRPCVRPNSGFWRQLIAFEYEKTGRNSVHMIQHGDSLYPDVYNSSGSLI